MESTMAGVEVEIPRVGHPNMPAYASIPEQADRGVVVLHEVHGRQPEIDRVVERFARAGYAAVEPDLFAEGSKLRCIRRALATIASGTGPMAERIEDTRHWLCEHTGLEDHRVGVIGFCLGGGLALAVGRNYAGVSSNYGYLPPDEILRESPPVIACYGGRDRIFARKDKQLRRRMTALGKEVETHVFPSVGHSFLTDGHHPVANALSYPLLQIRWDPEVAEEGWGRIMEFFDRTLCDA